MDDSQLEGWRVMLERNVSLLTQPAILVIEFDRGLMGVAT